MPSFSSRAGAKLDFALKEFDIKVSGQVCADLGCSTGGFTDCLLQHGAGHVYSVDTGYGVLDYKLRCDPKVTVLERTNAMHVILPEQVDFISIDVGWTRQALILPHALTLLKPTGVIVSLVKPHYEAKKAHLTPLQSEQIFLSVIKELSGMGIVAEKSAISPVLGEKAGNTEFLILVKKS